eukprot:12887522-Prorocentrum_lima.AAC.1
MPRSERERLNGARQKMGKGLTNTGLQLDRRNTLLELLIRNSLTFGVTLMVPLSSIMMITFQRSISISSSYYGLNDTNVDD